MRSKSIEEIEKINLHDVYDQITKASRMIIETESDSEEPIVFKKVRLNT